jgi:hypothetical protein
MPASGKGRVGPKLPTKRLTGRGRSLRGNIIDSVLHGFKRSPQLENPFQFSLITRQLGQSLGAQY